MPLSLHHTLITKSHHWSSSSWIYGRLNQLNAITELDICCMRALCHEPRRGKEEWAALFDKDEQGKDRNRKIDNRCRTLQSFGVMGSFFPLWWERRGWVSLRAWDHLRAARWCGLCEQQWEWEVQRQNSWACTPAFASQPSAKPPTATPAVWPVLSVSSSIFSNSFSIISHFPKKWENMAELHHFIQNK